MALPHLAIVSILSNYLKAKKTLITNFGLVTEHSQVMSIFTQLSLKFVLLISGCIKGYLPGSVMF